MLRCMGSSLGAVGMPEGTSCLSPLMGKVCVCSRFLLGDLLFCDVPHCVEGEERESEKLKMIADNNN